MHAGPTQCLPGKSSRPRITLTSGLGSKSSQQRLRRARPKISVEPNGKPGTGILAARPVLSWVCMYEMRDIDGYLEKRKRKYQQENPLITGQRAGLKDKKQVLGVLTFFYLGVRERWGIPVDAQRSLLLSFGDHRWCWALNLDKANALSLCYPLSPPLEASFNRKQAGYSWAW